MNIELTGKDLVPTDMLRSRIETKLTKIEQRIGEKLFVRVKLGQESPTSYRVQIHFNAKHDYTATGQGPDLVKAADDAIAKIDRQVRKEHSKQEKPRHPDTIRTIDLDPMDLEPETIA